MRSRMRNVGVLVVFGAVVVIGAGVLLFLFNPAEHRLYPKCLFHVVTGLDCPGCGGLRAAHQLLHGNVAAAFRFNPLIVCMLPAAALYGLIRLFGRYCAIPVRLLEKPAALWTLAIVVIAFGVLRNIWR